MKKIISLILVAALIFGGYQFFQKRKEKPKESKSDVAGIAFVVESDVLFPSLKFEDLRSEIRKVAESFGTVILIVMDGRPYTAGKWSINKPEENLTDAKLERYIQKATDKIITACNSLCVPKTGENDFFKGIRLAKQELSGLTNDGGKKICVISSGISRAGYMKFQDYEIDDGLGNYIVDSDPSEIAEQFNELHYIPDLSGFTVDFYGIGSSCDPQQISPMIGSRLTDLYEEVFRFSDCEEVSFLEIPLGSEPPEAAPEATVIKFIDPAIDIKKIKVKLSESDVRFFPNSSELIDEKAAAEIIAPYVKLIKENPSSEIWLVGMTATFGSEEDCVRRSKSRSERIKQLFLEYGASDEQIHTIGMGYRTDNPLHEPDLDPDGNLVESLARENRAVYILGIDDPDLQKILALD